MRAAGIKPDLIAGTSGGALIGALYASGIRLDRIEEIAKTIKWSKLMGVHFLFKGLTTSEPIEALVEELLGKGRRFADLGTELLVSTVDLVTERKVIYPERPSQTIALPVRASCSLPMVFSPVRDGERLLVDGGMLVPLPTLELRERGAEFVIAADFKVARDEPRNLFDVALRTLNITNQDRLAEVGEGCGCPHPEPHRPRQPLGSGGRRGPHQGRPHGRRGRLGAAPGTDPGSPQRRHGLARPALRFKPDQGEALERCPCALEHGLRNLHQPHAQEDQAKARHHAALEGLPSESAAQQDPDDRVPVRVGAGLAGGQTLVRWMYAE